MNKMKLFLLVVVILLVLIIGLFILHHFTYPIRIDSAESSGQLSPEDTASLAAEIAELGRRQGSRPAVELYSWVRLGDTIYYLMERDGQLGYATLIRGLNGGYKLDSIHYGSGDFREGIIVDRKTKYLLMAGKNNEPRIAKITAEMDGNVYEFVIEDDADHYFFCVELDPQPNSSDLNRGNIVFYDSEGRDITELYDLTGGAFFAP